MDVRISVSECAEWLDEQFSRYKGIESNLLIRLAEEEGYDRAVLSEAIDEAELSLEAVFHSETDEFMYHTWRRRQYKKSVADTGISETVKC